MGKTSSKFAGTALQTYSARLNTDGDSAVVFFAGRITDSPLLLGFPLVIPATSLTCTPGELRIGIVRNVPNKRQTSRRSFAFPASCRLGRQENSDRLKNTFHAPSPEPRPQLAGSPCSSAPAIHIYCEFSTQVPTTADSTAALAGSVLYCLVLCCRELQPPPPPEQCGGFEVEGVRQVVRQQG